MFPPPITRTRSPREGGLSPAGALEEIDRVEDALRALARDAEASALLGAQAQKQGVVVSAQVGEGDVAPQGGPQSELDAQRAQGREVLAQASRDESKGGNGAGDQAAELV